MKSISGWYHNQNGRHPHLFFFILGGEMTGLYNNGEKPGHSPMFGYPSLSALCLNGPQGYSLAPGPIKRTLIKDFMAELDGYRRYDSDGRYFNDAVEPTVMMGYSSHTIIHKEPLNIPNDQNYKKDDEERVHKFYQREIDKAEAAGRTKIASRYRTYPGRLEQEVNYSDRTLDFYFAS